MYRLLLPSETDSPTQFAAPTAIAIVRAWRAACQFVLAALSKAH